MKKGVGLLLSLTLVLTPFFSEAASSCLYFFGGPRVIEEFFEKINRENNNFLLTESEINQVFENHPLVRKQKIRILFNNIKFSLGLRYDRYLKTASTLSKIDFEKSRDYEIENMAAELSLALYGQHDLVDRFFAKSKEQRQRDSTTRLIGEKLLREGLLKFWQETRGEVSQTLWQAIRGRIYRIQKSSILTYILTFPFVPVKDVQISNDLMTKIILDGYDAHKDEVASALSSQNAREAYSTFRRLYSAVFFGTILAFQGTQIYDGVKAEIARQDVKTENAKKAVSDLREGIEEGVLRQRREIVEDTLKEMIVEFRQKWGEDPTPDEKEILRKKILKRLGWDKV